MHELVDGEVEIDYNSSGLMLDYWFRSFCISMCAKDKSDMSQRLGQNPEPQSCMQTEHKQFGDACVYGTARNARHHQN